MLIKPSRAQTQLPVEIKTPVGYVIHKESYAVLIRELEHVKDTAVLVSEVMVTTRGMRK